MKQTIVARVIAAYGRHMLVRAAGIRATLVVNKSDLGIDAALASELAAYAAAGYDAMRCSAASGAGLEALRTALRPGALHARRYESYRRLRRLRENLSAARGA
jgi:50S ribosomal subunit-associated GTPase HflX